MNPEIRLLALSARRHKMGYAAFEGSTRLLDWGVRSCGDGGSVLKTARKRTDHLLRLYTPSVVVVKQINLRQKNGQDIRPMLIAIRMECERRLVTLSSLRQEFVGQFFLEHACRTKHDISGLVAEWFPELAWILPPQRKPWEGESHSTIVFEAAATGITFLHKRNAATRNDGE